ncbi:MAG: hypothetical protein ACKVLM_09380 [Pseudomonadales bacterium]
MSESYEVVLAQVAADDLHALLERIEKNSQTFSGLAVSEELGGVHSKGGNKALIDSVITFDGDVCLTGLLTGLRISEAICLALVLLRVIKHKGEVDVELSFDDAPSLDTGSVMLAMQKYANALSNNFNVKEFYGGLEPAADADTRYFTGSSFGPLS